MKWNVNLLKFENNKPYYGGVEMSTPQLYGVGWFLEKALCPHCTSRFWYRHFLSFIRGLKAISEDALVEEVQDLYNIYIKYNKRR